MAAREATLSPDQARRVVEAATLAPSIHNTQPWRWRYRDGILDLFADPARQLAVADPDRRQLLVSCGAALLHAKLALRAEGVDPEVSLLPDGDDVLAGRLAMIRAAGRRPPEPAEKELAAAMSRRHTDRRPFDPRPLPAEVVRVLRRAAEAEGTWLSPLDDPERRVRVSVLLARADWVETHNSAYRAELESWSRTQPGAPDGIPREVVVAADEPRQSEFPLRDFDVLGEAGQRLPDPQAVERPGLVLIGTDADAPADRLRAGMALGRVLLAATAHGLATSPLGQALDAEGIREQVREAVGGAGHVQMILRVGYPAAGAEPLPATGRRAVPDVLDLGP
jgi:nitroreductase